MARWAAVTLGRGVDRGAAALELVRRLRDRGLAVAGFVQEKRRAGDREWLELVRLAVPERVALGTPRAKAPSADADSTCSFGFHPGGFAAGLRWLQEDAPSAEILIIDEIAKLELSGEGHCDALTWALQRPGACVVVLCTRAERLAEVLERFSPPGEPVAWLEILEPNAEAGGFVEGLASALAH